MTAETGRTAPDPVRQKLAIVCVSEAEIRADLRGGSEGDDATLERVLSAVRTGGDVASALDALHTVLQAGGDAQGVHGYAEGVHQLAALVQSVLAAAVQMRSSTCVR